MPTDPVVQYGCRTRRFTNAELKKLGIDGEYHPDEWHSPLILSVDDALDSHGAAKAITFAYEESAWQILVGYYHEDWLGTSDLSSQDKYPDATHEAWEVEPFTRVHYRRKSAQVNKA